MAKHTAEMKKGTKPVTLRSHRVHRKMLLPTYEELQMVERLLCPVVITAQPRQVRVREM